MSDYDVVTWESWIEAGRWMVPSGWLERQIIEANAALRRKGWQDLKLVYVKERTSLLNRTIIFEIRGQRYPLLMFQEGLRQIASPI